MPWRIPKLGVLWQWWQSHTNIHAPDMIPSPVLSVTRSMDSSNVIRMENERIKAIPEVVWMKVVWPFAGQSFATGLQKIYYINTQKHYFKINVKRLHPSRYERTFISGYTYVAIDINNLNNILQSSVSRRWPLNAFIKIQNLKRWNDWNRVSRFIQIAWASVR
jgi:hypothetical protein